MKYARIYKREQLAGRKESRQKITSTFEAIPEGEEEFALQKKISSEPFSQKLKKQFLQQEPQAEKLKEEQQKLQGVKAEIDRANKEYERLLQERTSVIAQQDVEAHKKTEAMLNEAAQKKKSLLDEAEQEKTDILKQAEKNASEILAEAETKRSAFEQEAREAGKQSGIELGKEESAKELSALTELLKKTAIEVQKERHKLYNQAERDLVEICKVAVRKVVKQLSKEDEKCVIRNISAALALADKHANLNVRVHPDDYSLCSRYTGEFLQQVKNLGNLKFVEDISIEQGGCFIESTVGAIDARISSQLQEVEFALEKIATVKYKNI